MDVWMSSSNTKITLKMHPHQTSGGQKFAMQTPPTLKWGGRGQRPTPTSPEDIAQVFQHFRLVRFSKFCPPTEWTAPFLPKNWDDLGTCGKARSRGHRSHRHVGHRSHFGSDYNFSAQAGTVHPAGQAAGQPAKPGETDRGRASPAGQSTI